MILDNFWFCILLGITISISIGYIKYKIKEYKNSIQEQIEELQINLEKLEKKLVKKYPSPNNIEQIMQDYELEESLKLTKEQRTEKYKKDFE